MACGDGARPQEERLLAAEEVENRLPAKGLGVQFGSSQRCVTVGDE